MIEYYPREFFGFTVHVQTILMSWLTMALVFIVIKMATLRLQMIPQGAQNVVESLIDLLNGLMDSSLTERGRKYMAPFIITLFMYIFIGNEIGLLPQIFSHFHFTSPTNDVNTTIGLAAMVVFSVQIVGIMQHGPGYLKHFLSPHPLFLPLTIVDETAKVVTMGFRLFGNILAGEILLIILYLLVPWLVPNVWVLFSLAVGFLQAFIFSLLSISHFAAAFREHH